MVWGYTSIFSPLQNHQKISFICIKFGNLYDDEIVSNISRGICVLKYLTKLGSKKLRRIVACFKYVGMHFLRPRISGCREWFWIGMFCVTVPCRH